ncbi:uncharacterized protein C4orf22 homolog [Ctenocephalides felis]|uniref:uncharacterized protein C4orf22 homolog n=1 Tax=Ctenocephalides felis TaxID=7515 RepID=UPI000E6E24DF|nr:uncharacterized protein C4orf22 homolog [Ctenocephalides felis]
MAAKTIIFLRHYTKTGFEISGYIDYAEKLVTDDWTDFFKGNKRLWPKTNDLGYYHWRVGRSTCNDTNNYKAIVDPHRGLLFQNRHDRLIICPDPSLPSPGSNTTRTRIFTDRYEHVVLYDHVVRSKC